MSGYTDINCLLRGLRDSVAAEGYRCVDVVALADLAFYAVQLFDRGEDSRRWAVETLRRLEAEGRAALEREAA